MAVAEVSLRTAKCPGFLDIALLAMLLFSSTLVHLSHASSSPDVSLRLSPRAYLWYAHLQHVVILSHQLNRIDRASNSSHQRKVSQDVS